MDTAEPSMSKSVHLARLQASIEEILALCAENEVKVPDELRRGLLIECRLREKDEKQEDRHSINEILEKPPVDPEEDALITEFRRLVEQVKAEPPVFDLRVKDGSYKVTQHYFEDLSVPKEDLSASSHRAKQKIANVKNSNPIYMLAKKFYRCFRTKGDMKKRSEERVIMDGVNLAFEPGKMYLVLGSPGSGKSTLLKMIANNLYTNKDCVAGGEVSLAGVTPDDVIWSNLVGYIDQIDRHNPYMTVFETLKFAWECRSGGTHRKAYYGEGEDVDKAVEKMDEELHLIHAIMGALGISGVKDTFVGDQVTVRGVSGGEKKRVTVAEMLCVGAGVLCCDEISTGLDAATTYDITKIFGAAARITKGVFVVSLLQPPPETVANFDELILLSEGKVIYSGPVGKVINHFDALGYFIPDRMDVGDWLQMLPTKDGCEYLKEAREGELDQKQLLEKHLSPDEFREKFHASPLGQEALAQVEAPISDDTEKIREMGRDRYANTSKQSMNLVGRRELLLWWRDKYQIKAKVGQALVTAIIVGTLFWQSGDNPAGLVGVAFQSMFTAVIGAMLLIVKQFPSRSIFYKQQDANFFPTWAYVAGRSLATIPNAFIDAIVFGTIVYFFAGFAYDDGASVANYIIWCLLLFTLSLTSGLFFSMYSSAVKNVTIAQAAMAVSAVILVLFSGFTVQPNVIPDYYIWVYWINMFAWSLRGLLVNEFDSGKYDTPVNATQDGEPVTITEGQAILTQFGFTDSDDQAYTFEWAGWGILFTMAWAVISIIVSTYFLNHIRFTTGGSLVTDEGDDEIEDVGEMVEMPFKRVDLTFKDIHYTVKASTSDDKLELLKGVDGIVEAGRMTALMGSSGAGKTTLMDVLALRKSSGEIEGEIRLNGHLQEKYSFRRCAGYVEQFDVQTPQLTIRETVDFSAKLRLDENDPAVTAESTIKFVEQTLAMLELTNLQDLQVGSDEEGGLSFEAKKRLSIAVEVASNPSILFLDEPTSGLDARAASIVMRGMKRIAISGRAVCATIHQPSVAIFNSFDSLLLLKRGGEVIFFGDLGADSCSLIEYLERFDATPKIQPGENPATWMLTTIGAGSATSNRKPFDYAGSFSQSKLHNQCVQRIDTITEGVSPEGLVSFQHKYATSYWTQSSAVLRHGLSVYFRSPSYNTVRVIVSAVVALLFGSVYASERVPTNESDMNSRVNSIFIAVVFLCVNAMNTVLGVFEIERNMFYRHKAALMYESSAILRAFTLAELPFILMTSTVFTVLFYFIMGFTPDAGKFFAFFGFVTFGFMTFTFLGQMFMSLVRDAQTAQGIGGLAVVCTVLFSGILLRPDQIPNFWIFGYWLFPGHYIFESIFTSQYQDDLTPIVATPGTPFYESLLTTSEPPGTCVTGTECIGTAEGWVAASFSDWDVDNIPWNALYFVGLIIATRVITYWALTSLNYRSN